MFLSDEREISILERIAVGCLAGATAQTIVFPLDVITHNNFIIYCGSNDVN